MAVALSITVKGSKELQAILSRISPKDNPAWVSRALVNGALLVQKIAAEEKILRGGSGPPVDGILTSRTGTLRRSIAVDRTNVPRSISVGTGLIYGLVHELGGKFHPPRPFLTPALEDSAERITDIFEKELDRELRK